MLCPKDDKWSGDAQWGRCSYTKLFYDYNMEKDVPIQNQGEIMLLKGQGHNFNLSLLELGHPSDPDLGHQHPWFSGPQPGPGLIYQPLSSRAFGL